MTATLYKNSTGPPTKSTGEKYCPKAASVTYERVFEVEGSCVAGERTTTRCTHHTGPSSINPLFFSHSPRSAVTATHLSDGEHVTAVDNLLHSDDAKCRRKGGRRQERRLSHDVLCDGGNRVVVKEGRKVSVRVHPPPLFGPL